MNIVIIIIMIIVIIIIMIIAKEPHPWWTEKKQPRLDKPQQWGRGSGQPYMIMTCYDAYDVEGDGDNSS